MTEPIDAMALLGKALGNIPGLNDKVIAGDEVAFHDGPKIILPHNMTYKRAYEVLKRLEKEAETPTSFSRVFRFRADDGAWATMQVIKEKWGMLLGKPQQTFFGTIPAEQRTIHIGVGQTTQVPWGLIEIPIFPGLELYLAETNDRDYGRIFKLYGQGPKKFKDEIESFFNDVQTYLEKKSIYRGHALIGSDQLEFLDLRSFRKDQIVFSDEVTAMLEGTVWAPLKFTEAMRREGVSLKRASLLYGPYGTGKTSIGQITAGIAVENGWTFISAKPGRDSVEDVLRTARLYQPAVVFVEDIDGQASSGENEDVTKLLEAFDGITSKGGELQIVMTTNHIERIHKGMLRPGRLDAVVEIAGLDRHGVARLIKAVIKPGKLDETTDFDAVGDAMEGFLPAFVRETITRAVTFAINRNEGSAEYVISTEDLVNAAHSLRPQLDKLNDAGEGSRRPGIEVAFADLVRDEVTGLVVRDPRGELAISVPTVE
jgi:hypothetical protein